MFAGKRKMHVKDNVVEVDSTRASVVRIKTKNRIDGV